MEQRDAAVEVPGVRPRDWFGDVAHTQAQLKRRSVRGVFVTGAGRMANHAVAFLGTLALARMIAPGEFGVVAMVMAVIGVADVLQDLGMSAATVRAAHITHEQVSNLFWINLGVSCTVALVGVACSPLVQAFYGDPRVEDVVVVLSLLVAVNGAATQHKALLLRATLFRELAGIHFASVLVYTLSAVAVASRGGGYWALVAGSIASAMVNLVLAWRYCDWRPGRPRQDVATQPLVLFGLHFLAFGLLGFFARSLHSLIIGRAWGAAQTGLYNRASNTVARLTGTLTGPMGTVAPAVMARLAADPLRYCSFYYKTCALVVMAAVPIAAAAWLVPYELIFVLFGPQWLDSGGLLKALSVGIVPQVIAFTTGWVYVSMGSSEQMMRWGIVGWSSLIVAVLAGSRFGLTGIAWATSFAAAGLMLPALLFAFRGTPLRLGAFARSLAAPVVSGVLAVGVAAVALRQVGPAAAPVHLVVFALAFGVPYLVLLLVVFGESELILDVVSQMRSGGAERRISRRERPPQTTHRTG